MASQKNTLAKHRITNPEESIKAKKIIKENQNIKLQNENVEEKFSQKNHVPFYTLELLKTKAWLCWGEVCLGKGLLTYYVKSHPSNSLQKILEGLCHAW